MCLKSEWSCKISLRYYSEEELKEIVESVACKLDLIRESQAARLVAKVAAGLPLWADHLSASCDYFFRE